MNNKEYLKAKAALIEMEMAIDQASSDRVPVFTGIAKLHDEVKKFESLLALRSGK